MDEKMKAALRGYCNAMGDTSPEGLAEWTIGYLRVTGRLCATCNGYGMVGNMIDSEPCPQCSAPVSAPESGFRSRVADLLHLLQFAEINTPSDGDAEQAGKAIDDLKAMLAASPIKENGE